MVHNFELVKTLVLFFGVVGFQLSRSLDFLSIYLFLLCFEICLFFLLVCFVKYLLVLIISFNGTE